MAHCSDAFDEANCCRPEQFQCRVTGVCISKSTLCDGWENCADGSDENTSVCASVNNHQRDSRLIMDSGKSTYIVVILAVLLLFAGGGLSVYYCRKRISANSDLPDILYDSAGDPLSPKPCRIVKPMSAQKNSRKDPKLGLDTIRMSALNGGSVISSYDRSHITGIYYYNR